MSTGATSAAELGLRPRSFEKSATPWTQIFRSYCDCRLGSSRVILAGIVVVLTSFAALARHHPRSSRPTTLRLVQRQTCKHDMASATHNLLCSSTYHYHRPAARGEHRMMLLPLAFFRLRRLCAGWGRGGSGCGFCVSVKGFTFCG
jgi:hypothetical protein